MAIGNPITLTNNVAAKTISTTATASQTVFTVTGGYRINQIAVFRNGLRLVESTQFTARDGSTVTLLSAASADDKVEFQVFDDFRVADAIVSDDSNQTIRGNIDVTGIGTFGTIDIKDTSGIGLNLSGVATAASVKVGSATTLDVTGLGIQGGLTAVGVITAAAGSFSGDVSVGGTITYEDVTNVDSVGLISARNGVRVSAGGINVAGVSTFSSVTKFTSDVRIKGITETVAAATTYNTPGNTDTGNMVIELDLAAATVYTYSGTANIGIVSFKNLPADSQNGATVTLIHTQNATGTANTVGNAGIGVTCTVAPIVSGVLQTGITTSALVGSGSTLTLTSTNAARDFISFFVHYNGGTASNATSYNVYASKNADFRYRPGA